VGGTEALSIEALARRVIRVLGVDVPIRIENHALREAHADRYCPDTRRIRGDLDLADVIPLDQAIARTAAWHRSLQPHAARTPPA
jgi:dTDP-glucose 4,6-dehydratase